MTVVKNVGDAEARPVDRGRDAFIQVLVDARDGSANIFLRRFVIKPGGEIPAHSHPDMEHVQYVLRGEYEVVLDGVVHRVKAGDVLFIPAKTVHSYRNTGKEDAEFLCVIRGGPYETKWADEGASRC